MKDILFNNEALTKIRRGINIATDAVGGTLGPQGRNVFIDDQLMPKITNDGVTVANAITLSDKFENMGVWMVKNICSQTNDEAGDGTTTTAVLFRAMVDECFLRPENPMLLKASLSNAVKSLIPQIKAQSRKVSGREDIARISAISSESDDISAILTEIITKKGHDTLITVDDSRTFESYYELTNGYEAQVGYMSPYMVTDFKSQRAIYKDAKVFCSEKRIGSNGDIKPLFDQLSSAKITSLVMIVDDIDMSVLGMLVQNKLQGNFSVLVIRATGPLLKDIASFTGSTLVSDETGVSFSNVEIKRHLGQADSILSDNKKTLFVANHPSSRTQIKRLEGERSFTKNEIDQKSLTKRIAKLKGSVAVIKVGAPTDLEREYLKDKTEDAINAVKSAVEEGIVEGGGMCLYRIAESMVPESPGEEVLEKALRAPLKKILENAGKDYAAVLKSMPSKMGYDAKIGAYRDMIRAGIIDPAKVERVSLENAVSAVSTFITTHCAITDKPDDKK